MGFTIGVPRRDRAQVPAVSKQVTRPVRNQEAPATRPQLA
jgi:hypothetical protein